MLAELLLAKLVSFVAMSTAAPWVISGIQSELDYVSDDGHPTNIRFDDDVSVTSTSRSKRYSKLKALIGVIANTLKVFL